MTIVWSQHARDRLLEIEEYIARDNPQAAMKLVDRLVARGEGLRTRSGRGRLVPEAPGSGLRELIEGNCRIIYRVRSKTVEIVTVFEGHRLPRDGELE